MSGPNKTHDMSTAKKEDTNSEIASGHKHVKKLDFDVLPLSVNMESLNTNRHEICQPISKLWDAWTYLHNPPKWVDQIVDLVPRSQFVVSNKQGDCHVEMKKFGPRVRLDALTVPRTLVCHDMKGGYIEDRFIGSINIGNCYSFYRWSQIDIFVYFSHHLITIPPLAWINVAHNNGVKILGTFITEFNEGEEICREIFINQSKMREFVALLVNICVKFKLDGWLLNIENKFNDVALLKEFVSCLTRAMHFRLPGSIIIWYDSVTCNGELKWQNELNDLNRCFFDVCDGIFLNYVWNEQHLAKTVATAEHRNLDVYVGVDVFGRNCYGGGHFNTYLAAQKIREYNLSMAIFAQGWTHETLPPQPSHNKLQRFLNRDNAFWRSLWPYLYTHPINKPFETFFYIGADKYWYKLHKQEMQLSQCLHSSTKDPEIDQVTTLKDSCDCLQLRLDDDIYWCTITNKKLNLPNDHIHRLFTCDINVDKNTVLFYYVDKTNEHFSLVLLLGHSNGLYKKVECSNKTDKHAVNNNCTTEVLKPVTDRNIIRNTLQKHQDREINGSLWCYSLQDYEGKILEIGAKIDEGDTVHVCGIGFINLN